MTKKAIEELRAETQNMPVHDPGPGTEEEPVPEETEETEGGVLTDSQLAATIDYVESHRVLDPSRTDVAPDTFNVLLLILQELRLLSQHIIGVNKELVPVLKELRRK